MSCPECGSFCKHTDNYRRICGYNWSRFSHEPGRYRGNLAAVLSGVRERPDHVPDHQETDLRVRLVSRRVRAPAGQEGGLAMTCGVCGWEITEHYERLWSGKPAHRRCLIDAWREGSA